MELKCKHSNLNKYNAKYNYCWDCGSLLTKNSKNEVTKGSNGQNNNAVGQGGGNGNVYIDSLPLRYVSDIVYSSDYVDGLKAEIKELKKDLQFNDFKKTSLETQLYTENIHLTEENKTLKFQLQELHQANVNLFNESEKLKKELKDTDVQYNTLIIKKDAEIEGLKEDIQILNREVDFWKNSFNSCVNLKISAEDTCSNLSIKLNQLEKELKDKTKYVYEKTETRKVGEIIKSEVETRTYDECLQKQSLKIKELEEQLETKETINQDLAKKYQLLQEEIDAYDINMLELVEEYSKLEKDYKELEDKYNSLQEYTKNSSNNLFKVNLQHKVKPYLSEGVINVIVESNKEFK